MKLHISRLFGLGAALVFLAVAAGNGVPDVSQVEREDISYFAQAQPLYVWDPNNPILTATMFLPTFPPGLVTFPLPSTQPELTFEYLDANSPPGIGYAAENRLYPYVLLKARPAGSSGRWVSLRVLIDTGADSTMFPRTYADLLGITLTKGKRLAAGGITGAAMPVWQHELEVVIHCDRKEMSSCSPDGTALPVMRIRVLIPEDDKVIKGSPLLGRQDVLDRLVMIFDPKAVKLRSAR